MGEESYVVLPEGVREPFEVYLNGVLQEPGADYVLDGPRLRFDRPLAKEGKLGALRWTGIFLGIAGSYQKNDSVDVVYTAAGRRVVASGLPIVPAGRPPQE